MAKCTVYEFRHNLHDTAEDEVKFHALKEPWNSNFALRYFLVNCNE